MRKCLFALSVTVAVLTACGAEASVPTTPPDSIVCGCDMPPDDGEAVDAEASAVGTTAGWSLHHAF